ncbi:hypothetical protein [Shewanella sp. S1-49-MNA-CIBAN-0167]|uniref:hypothetical protein n=1 Tax=Shewanella sp. S1-49-MNA-CIBAN-0167 TaxID=3140468 RepID=UPI00332E19D0
MIKAIVKLFMVNPWQRNILWCDEMGLTLENNRSCAPRLSEPEMDRPKTEPTVRQVYSSNKKQLPYD